MANNQTTIQMEMEPLKADTPVEAPDDDETEINKDGDSKQREVSGDDEESGPEKEGESPTAGDGGESNKVKTERRIKLDIFSFH